jgi:fluoroquinolone resistance protein
MKRENTAHTENETFEKVTFGKENPLQGVYEECRFIRSLFNGADLSAVIFRNCLFEGCDLSLAKVRDTSFQEVRFSDCKLLGVQFCECRTFLLELAFKGCMLKLSMFNRLHLKNTEFVDCDLEEADFTETDLAGAVFRRCDLSRTIFEHTNLEKADFRSATNYSINPETNRLRKARFSLPGVAGLLDRYGIEIE